MKNENKDWTNLNKKVTGNWYIRNNIMYVEIKRAGRATYGSLPLITFKYYSEKNKIFNVLGDNEQDD